MSSFATRLKELRGTESQASFASAIGIHRIQYAKYEAGKNSPSIDVLERICRIHACSADWLLGLKDHGVSVKAGDGNAIAIGAHASATVSRGKLAADCKACPYKKWGDKFRKAGGIIPGV